MSDLTKVVMLRSLDGRLWTSEQEYHNAIEFERCGQLIDGLAKSFMRLCEAAINHKFDIPHARALRAWVRQNWKTLEELK